MVCLWTERYALAGESFVGLANNCACAIADHNFNDTTKYTCIIIIHSSENDASKKKG